MRPGSQVEVQSAIGCVPAPADSMRPPLPSTTSSTWAMVITAMSVSGGAAGDLGDAVDRLAAHAGEFLAPGRVDVEADHAIAGVEQAPRQRSAHQADADQADSA